MALLASAHCDQTTRTQVENNYRRRVESAHTGLKQRYDEAVSFSTTGRGKGRFANAQSERNVINAVTRTGAKELSDQMLNALDVTFYTRSIRDGRMGGRQKKKKKETRKKHQKI